jgi:hypothetical protein
MTNRDIDDEPWPIPVRHEPPGPPPPRRWTPTGRWVVVGALFAVAAFALLLTMCVPSPFGVSPG